MVGIDFEMPSCCTNSSFEHCPFYNICRHRETIRANCKPNDCPLIEAIPKAEYEARLKADLAAILKEIQIQAEENIENIYEKDEDNILMLSQHNAFADCFGQFNDLTRQQQEIHHLYRWWDELREVANE